MSERDPSQIKYIKDTLTTMRRQVQTEARTLMKQLSKEETIVLLKMLFREQYDELVELIPLWVKQNGHSEPDEMDNYRRRFRSAYDKLYQKKMKELTGSDTLPDGSKKRHRWSAKNNSLLKDDMAEYNFQNMKFFMLMFFSDQIPEVAAFTRYKNNAGYDYAVMHGVLPRLSKYDPKSQKIMYCVECGSFRGHEPDCPVITASEEQQRKEREEALAFKEENPTISLTTMLQEKIRKK